MRPIATDTADFPKLREKGCIYVDKTKFMYRMILDLGTSLFFISRPRRFGKFLFELKVGEPIDRTFRQIRQKGYAEPYLSDGRPIWLIGLSFDKETRRLVECAAEKL